MNFEDRPGAAKAAMPSDLIAAHKCSSNHRARIEESDLCGCFFCGSRFSPGAIDEWIDENEDGVGQTALCPECGIDSVIGSASGFAVDAEFLGRMRSVWFA